jgi:hypothetical protein
MAQRGLGREFLGIHGGKGVRACMSEGAVARALTRPSADLSRDGRGAQPVI